jgi:hypothetical protein
MMNRIVLYLGSPAVAFAEWLMFELLRTPYRPPHDMLTFLGTEKYGLVALMVCIGILWIGGAAITFTTRVMVLRDYLVFIAVLAAILALIHYIVRNPGRPVTPWDLLWS